MKRVKINGLEVDLDKIENPKLRRVVAREREFIFFGSSKRNYREHADSKTHTDTSRSTYGDYSEASTHTDIYPGRQRSSHTEHKDYTDSHTDHSEHSEYSDHSAYAEGGPDKSGEEHRHLA